MKRVIGSFAAMLILSLPARAQQHPAGGHPGAGCILRPHEAGTNVHVQYFG